MTNKELQAIIESIKEQQVRVQDDAKRSASETYSKLHADLSAKVEKLDARVANIEGMMHDEKSRFEVFLERFKSHMDAEETDRKQIIELIQDLKTSKAGVWVERIVVWGGTIVGGALLIDIYSKIKGM